MNIIIAIQTKWYKGFSLNKWCTPLQKSLARTLVTTLNVLILHSCVIRNGIFIIGLGISWLQQ